MATELEIVYDDFFSKISDSDLLSLVDSELDEYLQTYLKGSIAYFKKCRKDIKNVDFDMGEFKADLDYEEIDILSDGMVLRWIRPQIQKLDMFRTSLGDRDFKMSSNANQLSTLLALQNTINRDLRKKIMSYRYNELDSLLKKK